MFDDFTEHELPTGPGTVFARVGGRSRSTSWRRWPAPVSTASTMTPTVVGA